MAIDVCHKYVRHTTKFKIPSLVRSSAYRHLHTRTHTHNRCSSAYTYGQDRPCGTLYPYSYTIHSALTWTLISATCAIRIISFYIRTLHHLKSPHFRLAFFRGMPSHPSPSPSPFPRASPSYLSRPVVSHPFRPLLRFPVSPQIESVFPSFTLSPFPRLFSLGSRASSSYSFLLPWCTFTNAMRRETMKILAIYTFSFLRSFVCSFSSLESRHCMIPPSPQYSRLLDS